MKIAILYGLFEGPALGKKMIAACTNRGHDIVTDANSADVIIAHSGGWLFLPNNITDKKIVIINASHKSEIPLSKRFYWRTRYDLKHVILSKLFFTWLHEFIIKLWYAITQTSHWLKMRQLFAVKDITPIINSKGTIVIQSADLSWYDKNTMQYASRFINFNFGDHDDCWRNPAPYLDITEN